VAAETGEKPVLLGHSLGGCLSVAYTLRHPETIRLLVLSAPAVDLGTVSPATRIISRILSQLVPKLGVFGVDPAGVSRDPDVVHDYETDPLVFHGKLPVRTIAELAAEIEALPSSVGKIELPVLLMYGTADPIVPISASEMLAERLGSPDLTVTPYEGLYHEILNEPERDAVIAEVTSWLGSRT
jgi:alpha-beta hydrolase superfamily lysophospholipase